MDKDDSVVYGKFDALSSQSYIIVSLFKLNNVVWNAKLKIFK
jgi:hypothetical protein